MSDEVVLHQFRRSHFNEKVRWALDWKEVAHRRVTHLPGPHALSIGRLTGGHEVPVLEHGGQAIAGSARILATLDERFPERPLHPGDPAARARALEIQAELDERGGPAIRAAAFSVLLQEPAYLQRVFVGHRGGLARAVYAAGFPVVRAIMTRSMGLSEDGAAERALATTRATLDAVARGIGPGGHLVGDAFTVADLAAAALLAPLANPDHPDMRMPEGMPERVAGFLASWQGHEAIAWVREQYARHRPAPLAE